MLSRELTYQATHDPLTGLINRREFEYRLHRLLTSDHGTLREHALCYIDLDQFKLVNDTCGHIAGDELLRRLAELLRTKVRKRDTLARLGGDEFGILLEHCSPRQALRVADDVCRGIKEVYLPVGARELHPRGQHWSGTDQIAWRQCHRGVENGGHRLLRGQG